MAQLTKERQRSVDDAPAIAAATGQAEDLLGDLAEDRSYGRAVLTGSVLGIVGWGAIVFAVLRLLRPELGAGPTLGIATWVGIWTGLFLGGTITVGLWADKRH